MGIVIGLVIIAVLAAILWGTGRVIGRVPHRGQVALAVVAWGLGAILLLIAFSALLSPLGLFAANRTPDPADMFVQEGLLVASVLGAAGLLSATWGLPRLADLGLRRPAPAPALRDFAVGAALGPVAVGVFLLAGLLGGWDRIVSVAAPGPLLANLAGGALLFALVAVAAEVGGRGCLLALLARAVGGPVAAVLSVLAFAGLHGANPGATPLALLGVGLAGAFFVFALLRTGMLWLPIGFHLGWDWAETSLYGYPDSGIPPASALQLAIDPQAPAWATGGAFGPEASLFVIPALALATLAVWAYTRHRSGRALLFPAGAPERPAVASLAGES
jgi:membrane protease YdiL (CAAX protease family)